MAGKRKSIDPAGFAAPEKCCGNCGNAYGFCYKGIDGKPICCRCQNRSDGVLKMLSEKGCPFHVEGLAPVPTKDIPIGPSPDPDAARRPPKVVPVFLEDGTKVCIPVTEIGPQGITMEDLPADVEEKAK